MFLTSKSLPRRTVLRGLGATLALPFLDAMTPAMALASQRATKPAHRFLAFYVPNGMAMEYWSPKGEGSAFELSPILQPLAAVPQPDAGALGHPRQLGGDSCRRVRRVSHRHAARRQDRDRDLRRHVDGPAAREAPRRRNADRVARDGDGSAGQRGRVHRQSELRLHAHVVVAQPDAAAADGVEPARGVREAVRRYGQHRSRGARGAVASAQEPARFGQREARQPSHRARPAGSRQGGAVHRSGARRRAPYSARGAAGRSRAAGHGPAAGRAAGVRRSSGADARSAAARVSERSDARDLVHARQGAERAAVSADRRARGASSAVASPGQCGAHRAHVEDQPVPHRSSSRSIWRSSARRRTAMDRCSIT